MLMSLLTGDCTDVTCVPFMSQIWTWLLAGFSNHRSLLPSPLTSPTALSRKPGPGFPGATALRTLVPFISQTETSPFEFCHSRSDLLSPLKSPVPAKRHDIGGIGWGGPPEVEGPVLQPHDARVLGVFPHRMRFASAVKTAG